MIEPDSLDEANALFNLEDEVTHIFREITTPPKFQYTGLDLLSSCPSLSKTYNPFLHSAHQRSKSTSIDSFLRRSYFSCLVSRSSARYNDIEGCSEVGNLDDRSEM
jgi:hypothetical protein